MKRKNGSPHRSNHVSIFRILQHVPSLLPSFRNSHMSHSIKVIKTIPRICGPDKTIQLILKFFPPPHIPEFLSHTTSHHLSIPISSRISFLHESNYIIDPSTSRIFLPFQKIRISNLKFSFGISFRIRKRNDRVLKKTIMKGLTIDLIFKNSSKVRVIHDDFLFLSTTSHHFHSISPHISNRFFTFYFSSVSKRFRDLINEKRHELDIIDEEKLEDINFVSRNRSQNFQEQLRLIKQRNPETYSRLSRHLQTELKFHSSNIVNINSSKKKLSNELSRINSIEYLFRHIVLTKSPEFMVNWVKSGVSNPEGYFVQSIETHQILKRILFLLLVLNKDSNDDKSACEKTIFHFEEEKDGITSFSKKSYVFIGKHLFTTLLKNEKFERICDLCDDLGLGESIGRELPPEISLFRKQWEEQAYLLKKFPILKENYFFDYFLSSFKNSTKYDLEESSFDRVLLRFFVTWAELNSGVFQNWLRRSKKNRRKIEDLTFNFLHSVLTKSIFEKRNIPFSILTAEGYQKCLKYRKSLMERSNERVLSFRAVKNYFRKNSRYEVTTRNKKKKYVSINNSGFEDDLRDFERQEAENVNISSEPHVSSWFETIDRSIDLLFVVSKYCFFNDEIRVTKKKHDLLVVKFVHILVEVMNVLFFKGVSNHQMQKFVSSFGEDVFINNSHFKRLTRIILNLLDSWINHFDILDARIVRRVCDALVLGQKYFIEIYFTCYRKKMERTIEKMRKEKKKKFVDDEVLDEFLGSCLDLDEMDLVMKGIFMIFSLVQKIHQTNGNGFSVPLETARKLYQNYTRLKIREILLVDSGAKMNDFHKMLIRRLRKDNTTKYLNVTSKNIGRVISLFQQPNGIFGEHLETDFDTRLKRANFFIEVVAMYVREANFFLNTKVLALTKGEMTRPVYFDLAETTRRGNEKNLIFYFDFLKEEATRVVNRFGSVFQFSNGLLSGNKDFNLIIPAQLQDDPKLPEVIKKGLQPSGFLRCEFTITQILELMKKSDLSIPKKKLSGPEDALNDRSYYYNLMLWIRYLLNEVFKLVVEYRYECEEFGERYLISSSEAPDFWNCKVFEFRNRITLTIEDRVKYIWDQEKGKRKVEQSKIFMDWSRLKEIVMMLIFGVENEFVKSDEKKQKYRVVWDEQGQVSNDISNLKLFFLEYCETVKKKQRENSEEVYYFGDEREKNLVSMRWIFNDMMDKVTTLLGDLRYT